MTKNYNSTYKQMTIKNKMNTIPQYSVLWEYSVNIKHDFSKLNISEDAIGEITAYGKVELDSSPGW